MQTCGHQNANLRKANGREEEEEEGEDMGDGKGEEEEGVGPTHSRTEGPVFACQPPGGWQEHVHALRRIRQGARNDPTAEPAGSTCRSCERSRGGGKCERAP